MLLQVGIAQAKTTCNALLDSGAAVNVMAEHIYKEFINNKSLTSTTNLLNCVSNQPINCKGEVTASVNMGAHKEECVFYVTSTKESAHDIILGHGCTNIGVNFGRTISTSFGRINLPAATDAIVTTTIPCATPAPRANTTDQRHLKSTMGHTQGTI